MIDIPPVELFLEPYAQRWIEYSLGTGSESAATHGACAKCERCPHCRPYHVEMMRLGGAISALQTWASKLPAAVKDAYQVVDMLQNIITALRQRYPDAQQRAVNWFFAWQNAQAEVNALAAASPWLASGSVPLDTTRISLTPRDGWTEVVLGGATRLWVADPAFEAEARQLAPMFEALQAYEAAVAQAIQAELQYQQAQAEFNAIDAALRQAEAELAAAATALPQWAQAQETLIQATLADWRSSLDWITERYERCITDCDSAVRDSVIRSVMSWLGSTTATAAAGLGVVAGAGMVMLGQPFDTGSQPVEQEPASVLIVDAIDGFTLEFTGVDPEYRTSFFAVPLDSSGLFPGVLGDPIDVTGIAGGTLTFDEPVDDPVGTLLGGYTTSPGDVVFTPTGSTGLPENGVFVVSIELDGNVLAPSFCNDRFLQFTTSIANPSVPGLYDDVGPFAGDYGQATNTIVRQELTDCGSPEGFVDMVGDDVQIGGDSAAGGIITTADDGTSRFIGLLPGSYVPPDASFRTVFFESQSGAQFAPDNTRYQSTPDDLTELLLVGGFPMLDLATTTPPPPPAPDPDETDPTLVALGLLISTAGAASLGRSAAAGGRRREDDETTTAEDTGGGTDGGDGPPTGDGATVTGPTGPPPGQADLDRVADGLDDVEIEARDEMMSVARSKVKTTALLYEKATHDLATKMAIETEEGWFEALTDGLTGVRADEAEAIQRATVLKAEALTIYRKAVADYVAAGLLSVAPHDRPGAFAELESSLPREDDVQRQHGYSVEAAMEFGESDSRRTIPLAVAEGRLLTTRIAHEVLAIAKTRIQPIGTDRTASTLLDELAKLEAKIVSTAAQRSRQRGQSEENFRMWQWFRDTRRTQAMDSLIILAEQGTLVDRRGNVVDAASDDTLRTEFIVDRLAETADDLVAAAWRSGDSRTESAKQLRSHIAQNYKTLDLLGNGTVDFSEYALATAGAIRSYQADVNTWRIEEYHGLSSDDEGGWSDTIGIVGSIRLGTQGRLRGYGDASAAVIESRIRRMNLTADRTVEALTAAAATGSPAELDDADVTLLAEHGYIVTDPDGTTRYRIPTADKTAARVTSLDKPGASWLDVVSVQNAAEIMLSVAVPELAAIRISAIAARLGVSARTIKAARFATGQGLGLAADVGITMLHEGGERSAWEIALESTATNFVGILANEATTKAAKRAFDLDPIKKVLSNPDTRDSVVGWTSTVLGVGDETLISIVAQSIQGHDVTSDDVLAALVASAMNRAISAGTQRAVAGTENAIARLPRGLREASVVLAPTLEQARAVDTELGRQARTRFDAVVGDSSLTRSTGSKVFEALRTGDLSWSELQRVYSERGHELHAVMDQVRIERDRFVASVIGRGRAAAVGMINRHFDERVSATQDTTERDRLERARQAELDKIDPVDGHRPGSGSRYAQKAFEIIGADRDELLRKHGDSIGEPGDRTLDQLRQAALEGLQTDVIQPGSAGPTSDIDISFASEWLRRGVQRTMEADMLHGRMTGELAPTTAAAYDTNNYLNVIPMISLTVRERALFEHREVTEVRVVEKDSSGRKTVEHVILTHAQTVLANSLAAAMLHMDSRQRERFTTNMLGDTRLGDELTRTAMLTHAAHELADSARALKDYTAAEAERLGTDPSDPETQLRARERLYGERMAAIDALATRIAELEPGDPTRGNLLGEYERAMNTALRDGIETYSDMTNLDIVVARMQSQKVNGRKLTPTELMRKKEFSIEPGGDLDHLTATQVRAMVNDQTLQIMHHVNSHRSGVESPGKAARSLAKYAERALLALNLLGEFDPDAPGKYSALFDITTRLMPLKDNTQEMMRALVRASPRGTRTEAEAMHWFLGEIEHLPGLDGLTRGPAFGVDTPGFQSTLAFREWERRSQEPGAVAEMLDDLATTVADLRQLETLAPYVPAERHIAADQLSARERLMQRIAWLSGGSGSNAGQHLQSLMSQLQDTEVTLRGLRDRGAAYTGPDPQRDVLEWTRARADAMRHHLEAFVEGQ